MPKYRITLPNGQTKVIEAKSPEAAAEMAVRPVNTGEDAARSGWAGLVQGGVGLIKQASTALDDPAINPFGPLIRPTAEYVAREVAAPLVARVMGADPKTAKAAAGVAAGAMRDPDPGALPGGGYEPQTAPGRYAREVGRFAPNAAAGPGGVVRRAASVAVPAVASEAAGEATERFGPGAEAAARAIAAIGGGMAVGMVPGRRPARPIPRPEADDALRALGADPDTLPPGSAASLDDMLAAGARPTQAAARATADSLPVRVPMTRGQEIGNPAMQLDENLALGGAKGAPAQTIMRAMSEEQQRAIRANVDAIAERVAGGSAPSRGGAGTMVSDRLNAMYDEAGDTVSAAYGAARNAAGDQAHLPMTEKPVIASALRESVRDFDPDAIPHVTRELGKIDNLGTLTARDLFETRERLSALRGGIDRDAVAAGKAVRALDGQIDDVLARDLFTGDKAVVGAWREAIGRRRQMGKLFEGDDLINRLTERTRHGEGRALKVDAYDATNYILGRSDLDFVGRKNLYRDLGRLRKVLGPESAEWNALRSEVFQRVASTGEGGMDGPARQFSGAKFAKAWGDFKRKDPNLVQMMFTPDEMATIDRFAGVAARVTNPVRGGANPPNTAAAVVRLLGGLRFVRSLPFFRESLDAMENAANASAARRAVNPALERVPRPGRPVTVAPSVAITAAGAIQQNERERRERTSQPR